MEERLQGKDAVGIFYMTTMDHAELERVIEATKEAQAVLDPMFTKLTAEFGAFISSHKDIEAYYPTYTKKDIRNVLATRCKPMTGKETRWTIYGTKGRIYRMAKEVQYTAQRRHFLVSIERDYGDVMEAVRTLATGYLELVSAAQQLHEEGKDVGVAIQIFNAVMAQLDGFNQLIGEVNNYSFMLYDMLEAEDANMKEVNEKGQEDIDKQVDLMALFHALFSQRQAVGFCRTSQNDALLLILGSVRKTAAVLKVNDVMADVKQRGEKLAQYKEEKILENIRDYEDLEGQDGVAEIEEIVDEALEKEEKEEASNMKYIIAAVIILALIAIFGYKYML